METEAGCIIRECHAAGRVRQNMSRSSAGPTVREEDVPNRASALVDIPGDAERASVRLIYAATVISARCIRGRSRIVKRDVYRDRRRI